jgi:tetratricopeptide (TPR) repeat protein
MRSEIMTDWFRNTTWNEAVERAFDEKLRRAKRKEQYLRIQACTLARSYPEVALKLLDRYFELPDDFDHAQAHVDRATALLSMDRVENAITSYEAALAREVCFPKLQTKAYLDLPYLIATRGIRAHYDRALEVLQCHVARLMFPVDHFRWHAARALIAADLKEAEIARRHAEQAIEAAGHEHSGFRYHPSVGLVTAEYDNVVRKLEAYRAA